MYQLNTSFNAGQRVENVVAEVKLYERMIPPVNGSGNPFLMMETQVTQSLYEAVMGTNPSEFKGKPDSPRRPVEMVSWEDGIVFANALSTAMGLEPAYDGDDNNAVLIEGANGFRYPLEAEWEWAAKGGEDHKYAGSDDIDEVGWHSDNSGSETHPVGQLKANGYGCYDFSGNVWEWCADDYEKPGQHSPGAAWRVFRGGSWNFVADYCRVSVRYRFSPYFRYNFLGLRFSRSLDSNK